MSLISTRATHFRLTDDQDGDGYSMEGTFSLNGVDAGDVVVPGSTQIMDEDGSLTFTGDNLIRIADNNNGHRTVTLSIEDGALNVGLADGTHGDLTVDGEGTNSLTLEGTRSAINAALDGLIYTPPADAFGERTLTVTTRKHDDDDDGDDDHGDGKGHDHHDTDTDEVDIIIRPVNDEPTLSANGNDPTFTEGNAAVDLYANIVASTVEIGQRFTAMTLTVSNVTDGAAEILGIDGSNVALTHLNSVTTANEGLNVNVSLSGGTATINFAGASLTPAELQAIIDNLTYLNASEDPTDANRVVTITRVADSGSNSAPNDNNTALSLSSTVDVDPVNDEPTLAATGNNPTFTENGASADLFSAVTASTIEAGQSLTAMTLTVSNVTDGNLEILFVDGTPIALVDNNSVTTATNGLDVDVDVDGSGLATVSFSGAALSPAALQAIVNGLAYRNNSSDPTDGDRVVTITQLVDSGSSAAPNDNLAALNLASTVNVVPVGNLAPALQNLTALNYVENDPATVIAPNATIADTDSPDFDNGTLTISLTANGSADDVLGIRNQGNGAGQIGVSGASVTFGGTVIGTFSGGANLTDLVVSLDSDASPAAVQALVRNITYANSSDNPSILPRTVTATVTDGDGGSAQGTAAINVAAVDDPPEAQDDDFVTDEATPLLGRNLVVNNGNGVDDVDGPTPTVMAINGTGPVGTTITLPSGALLTVSADGTFDYDPNGAFDFTPAPDSGASNQPSTDSFTYALTNGSTATAVITINGLDNDDLLIGTAGGDALQAGVGDDILRGLHGADDLVGGDGIDTADYSGNFGAILINLLSGVGLFNFAHGDSLADIENVSGTEFNDLLFGDGGANALSGNGGDDLLHGGLGGDALNGGAGIDTADYSNDFGAVRVNLATGQGSGNLAHLDTLTGIENVNGTNYNDRLIGDAGANALAGNGGNDRLHGGRGADSLAGGEGVDTADYDGNFGHVFIDLGTGQGRWNFAHGDALSGIENVNGSLYDDFIFGNSARNILNGAGSGDTLAGRGGDDDLIGAGGDDILIGGDGADLLDGGVGRDTASYADSAGGVTVDLSTGVGQFNAAAGDIFVDVENLLGSLFSDTLTGDADNNRINGGRGDDSLSGGDSNDVLVGGLGADALDGGASVDTADYSGSFGKIWINMMTGQGRWNYAHGDTLTGIEKVIGTDFNDVFEGNGHTNIFTGGAGEDLFIYRSGFSEDIITDFDGNGAAAGDTIRFHAGVFADFADMMANASQQGANVVIESDPNNFLVLQNVQLSDLHSSDFIFG